MQDHWTYADLAGRRRLRRYVFAAALIFVLIGLLFGWSGWQAQRAGIAGSTWRPASERKRGEQLTVSKNATVTPPPPLESCPVDPESWTLLEVYPGENYMRIEPSCVYEGLSRTVAWQLLARSGYTKPEAALQLGLPEIPWQPAPSITGLTNTKGPLIIPLEMEWAPHPTFRTWLVDSEGRPAVVYSLRGCYRTRTLVGNQVESWGPYAVICVLAFDRDPGWTVTMLGEQRISVDLTTEPALRRFALLGYADGTWVLLGEPQGQQMALAEPATAGEERAQVTGQYGTVPWDAAWLEATFGLNMRPLPEGWQHFGADPERIQAIIDELDQALQTFEVLP